MKIQVKVTERDYIGLMFQLTYRKPVTVILSLAGLVYLILCGLYFSGRHIFDDTPVFQLVFGLIILTFIPYSVYRSAKRVYSASQRLQEKIIYEFRPDQVTITGESYNVERTWEQTYKIEEIKNWFLIYETEKRANLIPQNCLSPDERTELRSFFKSLATTVPVKNIR